MKTAAISKKTCGGKKPPTKTDQKAAISIGHKSGHGIVTAHDRGARITVHDREGRIVSRVAKSVAQRVETREPLAAISYDAEDIAEANRIGEALCRQHAR